MVPISNYGINDIAIKKLNLNFKFKSNKHGFNNDIKKYKMNNII